MILFDASFKIPSKNDRPLFISISSNQILANPSRHLLRKPVSSRIDATRSNDSQPLPLEFPWISFSFPARHVHARVHRHTRTYACGDRDCICVGGRGALRSIYLRSSSSLAITKQRRKRARAPSDSHAPLLPPRDIWHGFAAGSFRDPPTRENTRLNTVAVKSDMERWFEGRNSFLKKRRGWWGLIN